MSSSSKNRFARVERPSGLGGASPWGTPPLELPRECPPLHSPPLPPPPAATSELGQMLRLLSRRTVMAPAPTQVRQQCGVRGLSAGPHEITGRDQAFQPGGSLA